MDGRQVPEQPVSRPGDVHLGLARSPARLDAGRVERRAQVPGLVLEEPAGELAQPGRLGLGRVQDHLGIHAGTVTPATDIQHSPSPAGSISAVQVVFSVAVFDSGQVNQDRPGPDADRLLVAEIAGEARHHAKWRDLTADEEAAAVAALRELAAGRPDLLAEVAGILEGASEGRLDEPFARSAARLCRLAGADETLISAWIAEGRRRAEAARVPPPRYS
jgi:hypothetical protein